MTEEQILFAFNNRWRIKVEEVVKRHQEQEPITYDVLRKHCLDFFRTGIILGERNTVASDLATIKSEAPLTPEEAIDIQNKSFYKAYSFDAFWDAYEKKVGRPKCEKLWDKLSNQDKIDCMAYIPRYKQAQPDKQYRKNPETFLRNKSWNDELIYRNGNSNNNNDPREKLASILTP